MKTKEERIKALAENELSPVRTQAALNALSEAELTNLEGHVTKRAEEKTAAEERAASEKKTKDEAAARAAAAPPTEEEWLKTAPPSIRTLVSDAKERETAEKTRLVASLKSAQKEYTEDELKAMSVKDLTRHARLLGLDEPVDFGGNGYPRAAQETDVYRNPPDGYRMALDARKNAASTQKGKVQ